MRAREGGARSGNTRVEVDGSGKVVVYSGVAAVGQGIETTLAQVVAEELALDAEHITVVHGDSARVPFGIGGFASRGAAVALPAALEAARKVREKIFRVAASLREAHAGDLVLDAGKVHVRGMPERSVTLRRLARAPVPGPPGMEPDSTRALFEAPKMTYPYGTHVAGVEVDPATGRVTVRTYVVTYDVGRAINPMIVDGQITGRLAQGLGGAIFEELVYDDQGQPLTTTFMDYLVPTAMDMPERTIVKILEETPTPLNPLGVKGVEKAVAPAPGRPSPTPWPTRSLGVAITELPPHPTASPASCAAPVLRHDSGPHALDTPRRSFMADRTGTWLGRTLAALVLTSCVRGGRRRRLGCGHDQGRLHGADDRDLRSGRQGHARGLKLAFEQIGYQTAGRRSS
jgi:hypothetical protein